MKAKYWQKGESLDYKNTSDSIIEENTIVPMKTRIGITGNLINPGEVGSLHVIGIFAIAKAVDSDVIELGETVYYSETGITKTAEGNTPAGYAAEDSAAGTKEIKVKLIG